MNYILVQLTLIFGLYLQYSDQPINIIERDGINIVVSVMILFSFWVSGRDSNKHARMKK